MSEPLVIYHGNCYDGFTAAWIARKKFPDCELVPAKYGDPPPDVTGRTVYVLDFSYPREVMEQMDTLAEWLVVLDHHKTAEAACEGLEFCKFDMERSGCRMTWDWFFLNWPVPEWILRIEDRDLWRWKYDDTAFVHAYVASLPMTFESWDEISVIELDDLVEHGRSIRQYIETYIEKAAQEARVVSFGGHTVVAVNVPYQNASEMGSYLLERFSSADYGMGYFQRADGRWQYSLRSRSGFDVSEVAKRFGGGGHAGAAGFETALLLDCLSGGLATDGS